MTGIKIYKLIRLKVMIVDCFKLRIWVIKITEPNSVCDRVEVKTLLSRVTVPDEPHFGTGAATLEDFPGGES